MGFQTGGCRFDSSSPPPAGSIQQSESLQHRHWSLYLRECSTPRNHAIAPSSDMVEESLVEQPRVLGFKYPKN
jgi:hypothetical protein